MTAFGSVHTAVEAMKIGAFDYVQKPFEIEEMEVKIEKALELRRLQHELDYLRNEQQDIYDFDRIVGSQRRAAAASSASSRKVAKSNSTVLDPRRNRHRQGADRRRDPPQLAARGAQLRQGELRRAAGEPARIGAVRPREGRVHRRRPAAHRPLRAGRRRHAVPRRDRRHERRARRPRSCACCRSTSSSASAARARSRVDVRLIAATNRDLPAMVAAGPVPRGPLLPPQRRLDRDAAAARAQGRHPAAGRASSSAASPAS